MKKWNLTLTIYFLLSSSSYAQFDRYKSRAKFQGNQIQNAAGTEKNADDNNAEAFGKRDDGFVGSKKDSKYVNLNPETGFGPEVVTSFDFPDTDILEITKHMQKLTGINLILEENVKGKVSITAPTPITVGDAWKAYLAALNMAGYALVKSGAFYKIISQRDLRTTPTKIYTGAYTPDTENHLMKVIALKHVSAKEITRNFRPFMSRYGRILDIEQTNTIIASDTGTNISRLEKLIKFVDVPGHESSLQIIPVRNSSAQEIAKLLKEIIEEKSGTRASRRASKNDDENDISKIIAEPRTNSIIAMATAEGARQLRNLIRKLDVRYSSKSSGRVHVYYLNYGDAEELSKTLSDLISNTKTKAEAASSKTGSRFVGGAATEAATTIFNQEVKVTADKNNNALVVTAAPTDWLTLKSVIAKLDIPRDQVYVEGMILEATLKKNRAFGVEYAGAYGSGSIQRGGFAQVGSGGSDIANMIASNGTTVLNGLFLGMGVGESREFTINGVTTRVNSVSALLKALASNENTNVLATPQILCTDNTEAVFENGETVPVQNAVSNAAGTTQSIQEQEAKLSLTITPQINKVTRFVKLKIKQKVDEFTGNTNQATAGTGLGKTVRLAQTEVMIRDGDTIAMGGLLRNRENVSTSKIPLLGDIPVLGWLFKSKSKEIQKTNLLFFLTPKILSPYDKTASKNSIELLKKRNKAIQENFTKDNPDPTKKLTDELVKKLERQQEGPIYDTSFNDTYEKTNDDEEGMSSEDL